MMHLHLLKQKQAAVSIALLVLGLLCCVLRLIYKYATAIDVTKTVDALSRAVAKPSGKTLFVTLKKLSQLQEEVHDHQLLLDTQFAPEKMDRKHMWYSLDNFSFFFRPEDMDTARTDPGYSDTLLRTASRVFEFVDTYRGAYSDNTNVRDCVCPFYCDFDGYQVARENGSLETHRTRKTR
ncbi:endoglucanase 24-like protein [Tanacetum coccineum]